MDTGMWTLTHWKAAHSRPSAGLEEGGRTPFRLLEGRDLKEGMGRAKETIFQGHHGWPEERSQRGWRCPQLGAAQGGPGRSLLTFLFCPRRAPACFPVVKYKRCGPQGRPGGQGVQSLGMGPERAEKDREWAWEQGKWRSASLPSKVKTLAVSAVEPSAALTGVWPSSEGRTERLSLPALLLPLWAPPQQRTSHIWGISGGYCVL